MKVTSTIKEKKHVNDTQSQFLKYFAFIVRDSYF